ncbi:DUF3416 domain-containing protein, partial [Mycobacterium tuberculosis]|nr:DUF3416 domain-containing protein [Mycobacterium tuberculosis]
LHRLTPFLDGSDRWGAEVAIDLQGLWTFRFEAFSDDFATWAHAAEVKVAAGVDVPVMAALGAELQLRGKRGAGTPPTVGRPTAAGSALETRQGGVGGGPH